MIKYTIGGMFWFKTQQEQEQNIVIHVPAMYIFYIPQLFFQLKILLECRIFSSINNKCFLRMPIIYFASELVLDSGCWTGLDVIKRKLVY